MHPASGSFILLVLMVWTSSVYCLDEPNDKLLTFDSATAVTNYNQFKTNLDRAQEFLINIYKGAYGGIGAFWFYYSYWLVLAAFYYSFATVYKQSKDEAEKEKDNHQRSIDLSHIDLSFIFNSLRKVQEKSGDVGESCYRRSLCEMRTYFATTRIARFIPSFM